MNKPLPIGMAVRKRRKEEGLTQKDLAAKAVISVQYVRAIEGGYSAISDDFKKKLADALNISVWTLFSDVKREVDLFNVLLSRHGRELTIRDNEIPMFKEVLSHINEDQFDELITSGVSPADVRRLVRTWAKDMNIEVQK